MAGTRKFEIHAKGGFSERKGIKNFSELVQVDSLNIRTRNLLFDLIRWFYEGWGEANILIEYTYIDIFSLTKEDIPSIEYVSSKKYDKTEVVNEIKDIFVNSEYNEIFDFLEELIYFLRKDYIYDDVPYIIDSINEIFENENVKYRIINNIITDIVNEEEINGINEAINNPYSKVSEHLQKALEKLYHDKDYSNSIKESISAVESMCQVMVNDDKVTLGQALKKLKNEIHPTLNTAFDKLYGYTSDANGIRHANGLREGESTFSEAKFMLVSCSAFVNYLKENFENK